jgi:hypothetical protein
MLSEKCNYEMNVEDGHKLKIFKDSKLLCDLALYTLYMKMFASQHC